MSYTSHFKSSNRAFDHLYDSTHKAGYRDTANLDKRALAKTAPIYTVNSEFVSWKKFLVTFSSIYRFPATLRCSPT